MSREFPGQFPGSVPFYDLTRSQPIPELMTAARDVISSGNFVGGDEVVRFESEFASFSGTRHCVGLSSGTSAIEAALIAVGVSPGDEVITVSATFAATAAAIANVNAVPVFVDIDPGRRTMSPKAAEAALTSRTRALLPVDLYGHPAELESLTAVARRHGLAMVEDAAQAHGARYQDRPIGSVADVTCFSFYPSKNLGALGDGGAVTTDRSDIAERIRQLRDHGRSPGTDEPAVIGRNWRLDAIQAAFLRVKLAHLPEWVTQRHQIAEWYGTALADVPLTLPFAAPDCDPAYHLYVVRCAERDQLREFLADQGVMARVHYPYAVHQLAPFRRFGALDGELACSITHARECLSLPFFPGLTQSEVAQVADAVAGWAATRR